jgi:hypothetical protein
MQKSLLATLAAASLVLTGCGKDATDPTPSSVAGTYTLTTVNGEPLPFVTSQDETYTAEILASTLTLRADGGFTWSVTGRSTDNGQTTTNSQSFSGTYTVSGPNITLTDSEDPLTGTVGADTITLTIPGVPLAMVLVFER